MNPSDASRETVNRRESARIEFESLNTLATMSMDLTDATGSGADLVRVRIAPVKEARA